MDEVGSQLEGQGHVTGNGTEVHVSGSTGRQLAPGLLYIDQDKNQNAAAKVNQILYTEEIESVVFPQSVRKYFYVTKSVFRKQSYLSPPDHSYSFQTEMRYCILFQGTNP